MLKKTISISLTAIMLLSFASPFGLPGPKSAYADSISILHAFDFNDYTHTQNASTIPATVGPAFSASVNIDTANGEYIDTAVVEGRQDKSLVINTKTTSGLYIAKYGLNIMGKAVFEASVRFSDTTQDRSIFEVKNAQTNKFAVFFKFKKNGKVEINSKETAMAYQPNTWYKVKAVLNNADGTADFYIDDVQLVQNERLLSAAPDSGPNTVSQMKFFQTATAGNTTNVQMILDDIRVIQINSLGTPIPTGQFVNGWEAVAYAGAPVFEEDPNVVHNGKTSMKLTGAPGALGAYEKEFPVEPGERYTFSAFWKGTGFDKSSYIRAVFTAMKNGEKLQKDGFDVEEQTAATTAVRNDFLPRNLYAYTAPADADAVRVQLVFSGPGTAWFNDPLLDKDKLAREALGKYSSADVPHPIVNPQNMFASPSAWNAIANEDTATIEQKIAPLMDLSDEALQAAARSDALTRTGINSRGSYEAMARRLAVRFTQTGDDTYARKAIILLTESAKAYPEVPRVMVGNTFFFPADAVPVEALYAYDLIYRSGQWTALQEENGLYAGEDIRETVEGWYREAVMNLYNMYSPGVGMYDNIAPYGIVSVFGAAAVLNDPDMIRLFIPWIDSLLSYHELYADGFWMEATVSYHEQVFNLFSKAFRLLQENYRDPSGYVDDAYRLEFTPSFDLGSRYPLYRKGLEISEKLKLPNGNTLAINDTHSPGAHPNLGAEIQEKYIRNIELNHYGLFSLTQGDERDASFASLSFPQNSQGGPYLGGGHQHAGYLNMTLFGSGMEVLPDPGYPVRNGYAYAYDQMTAPMHNMPWAWSSTGNYTSNAYLSTRGSMLAYDPGDKSNKAVQLIEGSELGPETDQVDVKRRLLMMVHVDGNRSYTLDLSRLRGGEAHQTFLRASEDEDTELTTSLSLTQQPDADVKSYMARIGHSEGLPEARALMKTPQTAEGGEDFQFTWTGRQTGTSLRAYMNGIDGNEIIFSRIPTMRRTELKNENKDNYPGWHFQRRQLVGQEDTTRFGAVYETWRADQQPLVRNVVWEETDDPMTQIVKVESNDYVDWIYISDDTLAREIEGVQFAGRAAMLRQSKDSGSFIQGYLYGEGRITAPGFELQGKPDLRVEVIGTESSYDGPTGNGTLAVPAAHNALIASGSLPSDGSLDGVWLRTEWGDRSGSGMRIEGIEGNRIKLRDYPTFQVVPGGAKGTFYPFVDRFIPGTVYATVSQVSYQSATNSAGKPGMAVLSHDNGFDTGLQDGDYNVTMNLWHGNNATLYKLYENDALIDTQRLTDRSPNAQTTVTSVTYKPNGTYRYYAELSNAYGTTRTDEMIVAVSEAAPAKPVLAHDNWDGDGNFNINMNLWWGSNGQTYRLYENGVLIDTQELIRNTPSAQSAATAVTGRPVGTYEYRGELVNYAGTVSGETIRVKVSK